MIPAYWSKARKDLSAADPVMAAIIARYEGEGLKSRGEAFHTLVRSIVGQQISVKAADAVWGKLEAGISPSPHPSPPVGERGGVRGIEPQTILETEEEILRACGLSRQKIAYLRAIAEHFDRHAIGPGYFDAKSDEEVLKELVSVKGIGKWTAEMFLIFHLLRPDVFPVDDIGVQKAMVRSYAMNVSAMSKKELYAHLHASAERWRPWRSVATWYLWRSLDPLPVEY